MGTENIGRRSVPVVMFALVIDVLLISKGSWSEFKNALTPSTLLVYI